MLQIMEEQTTLNNNLLKPFVKWADGKNQLLLNIQIKYPLGLVKNINKYCEPLNNLKEISKK